MVDAIVEMKRSSEEREKFDADGPPGIGALKAHKMAEKVLPAVIGFGWILSAAAMMALTEIPQGCSSKFLTLGWV